MTEKPTSTPEQTLELIPGDTFALREELKALGAVWDKEGRVWRAASDKLPLATALVEHQNLLPAIAKGAGSVTDPFEQEAHGPKRVTLGKQDGATYEARDALRAVGAKWDKEGRVWTIREDRAPYARAVLAAVVSVDAPVGEGQAGQSRADAKGPQPGNAVPLAPAPAQGGGQGGTVPPGSILLGGLRVRRGQDGKAYLTGTLSPMVQVLVVPNPDRTGDDPLSHLLYLVPTEPGSGAGDV